MASPMKFCNGIAELKCNAVQLNFLKTPVSCLTRTFRRAIGTAEICNRTPTALLILMSIIMLSAWKDGRNLILRKN